jgi:hypothetical protein
VCAWACWHHRGTAQAGVGASPDLDAGLARAPSRQLRLGRQPHRRPANATGRDQLAYRHLPAQADRADQRAARTACYNTLSRDPLCGNEVKFGQAAVEQDSHGRVVYLSAILRVEGKLERPRRCCQAHLGRRRHHDWKNVFRVCCGGHRHNRPCLFHPVETATRAARATLRTARCATLCG